MKRIRIFWHELALLTLTIAMLGGCGGATPAMVVSWVAQLAACRGCRPPLDLPAPGLVALDCQKIFCHRQSPAFLADWPLFEPQALALVAAFMDRGLPVVFTRHVHRRPDDGGLIRHFYSRVITSDDPLSALCPPFDALANPGCTVEKSTHAAFDLGLPPVLENCRTLVLCGVQAPLCVTATALALARHGIVPVVAADAVAAASPADHRASLRVLAAGHAHVTLTADIIDLVGRASHG